MKQENMTIIENNRVTKDVHEIVLRGKLVAEMKIPGQFINIKVPREDLILRRPISLAAIDPHNQTCTVLIRSEGQGTKSICAMKVGSLLDVMGPLGHGFNYDFLKSGDSALLIGGGIGIPPLFELAKQLVDHGINVTSVLGFTTKDAIFYERQFNEYSEVLISTDDGSYGTHGTVATLLSGQLVDKTYSAIYACGPKGLNRMVNQNYKDHPNAYVSLEERMACGMGACAACVCQRQDDPTKNEKVCDHGPVFRVGEMII